MFEIKGDKPQWETVYDLLSHRDVDAVITYDAFGEALGYDLRTNRSPLSKAVEVLQRENQRTVDNVRNVGYRIVAASEHARLAQRQIRKAGRSTKRGKGKALSANRAELTPEGVKTLDTILLHLAGVDSAISSQQAALRAIGAALVSQQAVNRDVDQSIKSSRRSVAEQIAEQDRKLDRLIGQLRAKGSIDDAA
jgi:hypothetical protein